MSIESRQNLMHHLSEIAASRNIYMRTFIIVLLTTVFTILCLRESEKIGRLASAPNYDDVVYFHEGAILNQSLKNEGASGFWEFLNERGLHSPYSIFLAAIAFAVLGTHVTSPYIANSIVVLAYLIGIGWFLRRLPLVAWSAGLLLFLTPPFITMGVVEFRPDIAWAVTVGFGVVFVVTSDEIFRNLRRAAFAGLVLAMALLIKPSTFVMTLLLYTGAVFSRFVAAFLERRWRSSLRKASLGTVAFLGCMLALAGPYWFRFGKDSVDYFLENSFGQLKAIWAYTGSRSDFLLYYVTGEGANSNLAIAGEFLLVLVLLCLIYLAVKRAELRWKLFSLLVLLAGALAVNTAAQMKSAFLGGGIYGVLLFSSAYIVGTTFTSLEPDIVNQQGRKFIRWRTPLLVLAAVVSLFYYRWPAYSNRGYIALMHNSWAAYNFMQSLLDKYASEPPKSILFTSAGPIVMESTGMWFPEHGLRSEVDSCSFIESAQKFKKIYPRFPWVVVQEQGVMGTSENMPTEKILPQLLLDLQQDGNFKKIAEFISENGKKVWVYSQRTSDEPLY